MQREYSYENSFFKSNRLIWQAPKRPRGPSAAEKGEAQSGPDTEKILKEYNKNPKAYIRKIVAVRKAIDGPLSAKYDPELHKLLAVLLLVQAHLMINEQKLRESTKRKPAEMTKLIQAQSQQLTGVLASFVGSIPALNASLAKIDRAGRIQKILKDTGVLSMKRPVKAARLGRAPVARKSFRGARRAPVRRAARGAPRARPRVAPRMARVPNKQMFYRVIDKLPPAALGDIKSIMIQAVDFMDDAAINQAANQFATRKFGGLFGPLGTAILAPTPAQKKATVKRMIGAAKSKQAIKNLISNVSDASFDQAVQKAMSNSATVRALAQRPENTFIAKRMAGAVLNTMHPQAKKDSLLQIIHESNPEEFIFMKHMIKMQIYKASSKMLKKMADKSHYAIMKREFGEVGAWFVEIIYHMGLVPDSTIKSKAMKFVDTMDKRQLLWMVGTMDPMSISGMINMSLSSWGFRDTSKTASNPRAQAAATSIALRSFNVIMSRS